MKTPRDMFLERHRAAEPALDIIRRRVVADLKSVAPKQPISLSVLLWTELVLPCRRIWAGLAAVWVVILVLNFENQAPGISEASHGLATEISPQAMAILAEQWRLQDELTMAAEPPPAIRRTQQNPRPRSEALKSVTAT